MSQSTVMFEDGPLWVDVYLIYRSDVDGGHETLFALRAALAGPHAPPSFVGKSLEERRLCAIDALRRSAEATKEQLDARVLDTKTGHVFIPDDAKLSGECLEVAEKGGLMCATYIGQTPNIGWTR